MLPPPADKSAEAGEKRESVPSPHSEIR